MNQSPYRLLIVTIFIGILGLEGCKDAPLTWPTPGTGGNPAPPAVVVPPATVVSSSTVGPFTYTVPAQEAEWLSYNGNLINGRAIGATTVQESATLRLEVRKEYGGSIQIYDKTTNQYLVNFFDKGRESGFASYAGPRSFADDSPRWKGVGYNPLQAGDDGGNPSPVLFHGLINGYIYTKTQCLSWAHQDKRLLPFFYEQWVRLDENKVHVKVRLTNQRGDKGFYNFEEQEWPFLMINGAKSVRFYNGSAPFTNAATSTSDGIERAQTQGGSIITQQISSFYLTEPWEAVEIGANRLIGLYSPEMYRANYNVAAIPAHDNWEGGNTMTYLGGRVFDPLDSDNTWLKEFTLIVGTEAQIREHVYAQPRLTKPDFWFDKTNGRNQWYVFDGGHDQKQPFRVDNWTVTYDGHIDNGPLNARGTKILSSTGSWRASDIDTIYIRMGYKGPEQQLNLTWLLNGQSPDGINPEFPIQNSLVFPRGARPHYGQVLPISVVNDGQIRTYRIPMRHSLWKDIVQQFEIIHTQGTSVIAPGEQIELVYFGTTNPDK
ncbi:hypothetical protein M0L20_02315 [Spirosoma sp. RP8]|uniref:Uncharacterized protein n=1 Tax=Spirosoma liriopis TaxID=2937440 RepID=A0ABT0HET4_9BACT|nr:hypothetical protein [Spirosoma liriopis]MCK8490667.1 hypothetical protein [Spirosoma liriopis]